MTKIGKNENIENKNQNWRWELNLPYLIAQTLLYDDEIKPDKTVT